MTDKQAKILDAALLLFAEQGFSATSTSKVAKEAGVSEGLIFRHFENKEGLLAAILLRGSEKIKEMHQRLALITDPNAVIRQMINMPFNIPVDERPFWKLLYALKWQADVYDDEMSAPVKKLLIQAFTKLGSEDPNTESEVLMAIIDGLAVTILLKHSAQHELIRQSILSKYSL
ncbi:MAG: AcrR family transcriptional regulator [Cyclobacteriaceae bacterium]|jgi:AcrR family transcriptional regulator